MHLEPVGRGPGDLTAGPSGTADTPTVIHDDVASVVSMSTRTLAAVAEAGSRMCTL